MRTWQRLRCSRGEKEHRAQVDEEVLQLPTTIIHPFVRPSRFLPSSRLTNAPAGKARHGRAGDGRFGARLRKDAWEERAFRPIDLSIHPRTSTHRQTDGR